MVTSEQKTIATTIREGTGKRRSHTEATELLPDFKTKLGLPAMLNASETDKALNFIIEVILAIAWYERKLKWAQVQRWAWFVCSGVMVLAIPVVIAGASILTKSHDVAQAPLIVGQLTGALTGVMGLQRLITTGLAAHQRYGAWWKASSDLKKLWYGLLTNWSSKDLAKNWTTPAKDDFLKDMMDRTTQGQSVVSDEQADFFQKLTLPSVDVVDVITKARTDAAGLIGNLMPGAAGANAVAATVAAQASDLLKARQDVEKNAKLVAGYDEDIATKAAALEKITDPALKTQAAAALDALQKLRDAAALAKRQAEATVAGLQTR